MVNRIVSLVCLVLLCASSTALAERLPVMVSIIPQRYFVEKIGGSLVESVAMVRPGASPATYEPKPRQMAAVAKAKVYFAIGVPFETTWLDRLAKANPDMAIVHAEKGIKKLPMAAHHHEEDVHEHEDEHEDGHKEGPAQGGILDPHVWLSPALVKVVSKNILKGLIQADSANTATYQANYDAFLKEIEALDVRIKSVFSTGKNKDRPRRFLVFHPSWGYFAKEYGLEQIPIELEGKEPSPKELGELVKRAQAEFIRVVFVQPQFSNKSAKIIAREIGAEVVKLDPLAQNWAGNLLKAADAFEAAFRAP